VLKNRKDFQDFIVPAMHQLANPATIITERSLSLKLLKLKRWFNPVLEDHNESAKAIKEKYITPGTFGVDRGNDFLSGNREDFYNWKKETREFLDEEIPECDISFEDSEFEGSTINFSTFSLLNDAGLLV